MINLHPYSKGKHAVHIEAAGHDPLDETDTFDKPFPEYDFVLSLMTFKICGSVKETGAGPLSVRRCRLTSG